MNYRCPICKVAFVTKAHKPGTYKPKCPKCGAVFQLVVPLSGEPMATALRDADATAPKVPPANDPNATAPSLPPPEATDLMPGGKRRTDNVERTAAHIDETRLGEDDVSMPSKLDIESDAPAVPETVGGYRILRELGRGGMGAVYLATQVSLDRPVALKVMNRQWGSDATFVARFTREAYAAAQLVHHNIVQIYDIGAEGDLHFFSMEYVEGQSLGDLVKKEGKLDPELAINYTLQAARGLKFAHDRGMVHRDIKPDNLMVNTQGIVKVADLGLVKTPQSVEEESRERERPERPDTDAGLTRLGVAMGTPAYMSPEQARNAAGVDGRADIYSLGCTLYVLLTGQPPFKGSTVLEVLSKHATQPIVPPDVVVKRVPKEVSGIIHKMVAKKPEDRYADMGQTIAALEGWLGVNAPGGTTTTEEQASALEDCVKQFNDAKSAKLRTLVRLAFFGGCLGLAVLTLLLGFVRVSGGLFLLGVEASIAYFVVSGLRQPGTLFERVRRLVVESKWRERFMVVGGVLLLILTMWAFGQGWILLLTTLLAVVIGFGLHYALDGWVETEREPARTKAAELFRSMRLKGTGEEDLRHFACKYGGDRWEEFFEDEFGFEEKLAARDWWVRGQKGKGRQKFGAWREPVVRWLDAKLGQRRSEREVGHLQKVEQKRLQAEGVGAVEARDRAEAAAEVMVNKAAEFRREEKQLAAEPTKETLRKPRPIAAVMLTGPGDAAPPRKSRGFMRAYGDLVDLVIGPPARFLVGAVLIAGCLLWMMQNGLIAQAQNIQGGGDAWRLLHGVRTDGEPTVPLSMAVLPGSIGRLFAGYAPLVAGLFLILSSLVRGWKLTVLMPVAAAVTVLGPSLGVPDIGPLSAAQVSLAAGSVLSVVAMLIGPERYRG